MVPTRDGVLLKTILFHLASVKPPGPVVLLRTPYNQEHNEAAARRFAAAGYYAVTQDCRGRFGSGGSFGFYPGEGRDGYDTAEWIRKQTWCNGKVATWGHSYLASDQWLTAALGTPLFHGNNYCVVRTAYRDWLDRANRTAAPDLFRQHTHSHRGCEHHLHLRVCWLHRLLHQDGDLRHWWQSARLDAAGLRDHHPVERQ